MLKINVVLVNGKLIGKTVSDRWNLQTLGMDQDKPLSQTSARRLARDMGCQIVLHKVDTLLVTKPTKQERASLGQRLSRFFSLAA